MACPICNSTTMTFLDLFTKYVDEPILFTDGDIYHNHDPNPRIGTWLCKNRHEFTIENKAPCRGCMTTKNILHRFAQQTSVQSSRMRPFGSTGNDHQRDSLFMGPPPGMI